MPFNLYIYGAVALVVIGLAGTVAVYKAKAETAQIKQEVAEQQRDTMLEVNQQILTANTEDAKLRDALYEDFKTARDDAEDYRTKLAKHDLSALAQAKPGLITRLARRATDKLLRQIEAAANSRATEEVSEPTDSGHSKVETSPPNDNDS